MTIHKTMFTLLMFASLSALAGGSQMEDEFQALRQYCKADVERLCPNVEPGGGRIIACLKANKEQMTVGCAQALMKLKSMKQK